MPNEDRVLKAFDAWAASVDEETVVGAFLAGHAAASASAEGAQDASYWAREAHRLAEELSEAVDLLNGVGIFVKSREQIKKPEGRDWFDKRLARAREALAASPPPPVQAGEADEGDEDV